MKTCSRCRQRKTKSLFNTRKGASDGLRSECKDCGAKAAAVYRNSNKKNIAKSQQAYRKVNKVKLQEKDKKKHLLSKYNLTLDAWNNLLLSQNGGCAICSKTTHLQVDHDHATGRIRGLLCGNCNRGLGLFGDDVVALAKALSYLTIVEES